MGRTWSCIGTGMNLRIASPLVDPRGPMRTSMGRTCKKWSCIGTGINLPNCITFGRSSGTHADPLWAAHAKSGAA